MKAEQVLLWNAKMLLETVVGYVTLAAQGLSYHVYTIWLFTFSDLKTIVGPQTAFAITSTLSGPMLTIDETPNIAFIFGRIPRTVFWTWINLLPFAISNQRHPQAILEDSLNKPWRALPSKRLTEHQAKNLMLVFYLTALVSSYCLGGMKQCVLLIILGFWYNDLGGADSSCITRNLINACGFLSFATGATEVTAGSPTYTTPFHPAAWQWFLVIGAIVFSSVHTQDMYDQAGDSLRGRNTVPLVIGDSQARWTIAVSVALWSIICPAWWQVGVAGYLSPVVVGTVIVLRTLSKRLVVDDKTTFRIWNFWLVLVYSLPLMKRLEGTQWVQVA